MSHKERFNQTLEIAQDMYENQLTLQQVADKHDMKRSTVHWRLRYFLRSYQYNNSVAGDLYAKCDRVIFAHKHTYKRAHF